MLQALLTGLVVAAAACYIARAAYLLVKKAREGRPSCPGCGRADCPGRRRSRRRSRPRAGSDG